MMPTKRAREKETATAEPDASRRRPWWHPVVANMSAAEVQTRQAIEEEMRTLLLQIDPGMQWTPGTVWLVPIPILQACVRDTQAVLAAGRRATPAPVAGGSAQQRANAANGRT
jgi:hypothetical protein